MNGWCKACGGINHEGHDLIEHCPDCGGIRQGAQCMQPGVTYRHCFCGTPKPKPAESEITRTVAIEHAGEKIAIEVHIHLSKEEIERLARTVEQSMARRTREVAQIRAHHRAMTIGRDE